MPRLYLTTKVFVALSIFTMPTLSQADGIFGNQSTQYDVSIKETKKSSQDKSKQVAGSKKTIKTTEAKKSSKSVKSTKSGSAPKTVKRTKSTARTKTATNRTVKSYVAFRTAGKHVSTRCFPKRLRTILSKVQRRYGVKPIINSGYRSPSKNRRVGGARRSYHVKCLAADIKVPGVNKYALARYLKRLSGVGGVGTYACKSFIHVDVGPKRSWHWRCRGKRGRRA